MCGEPHEKSPFPNTGKGRNSHKKPRSFLSSAGGQTHYVPEHTCCLWEDSSITITRFAFFVKYFFV